MDEQEDELPGVQIGEYQLYRGDETKAYLEDSDNAD